MIILYTHGDWRIPHDLGNPHIDMIYPSLRHIHNDRPPGKRCWVAGWRQVMFSQELEAFLTCRVDMYQA